MVRYSPGEVHVAQIMIVEPDEIAITALEKIFRGDEEIKLRVKKNFDGVIETLNGNPGDKEIYEKLKAVFEAAKAEFQQATAQELSAKVAVDNVNDMLAKHADELEGLKNPDPKAEKADAEKMTGLQNKVEQLTAEVKKLKEILFEATKIKSEKEKIFKEKESMVAAAKEKIPSAEAQVYSVLLIANQFLVPNATEWVANFKKAIVLDQNKNIKIVVLGFDSAEKTIKKYLIPGVSDYMIKPADELLARQNLKFLALGETKAKREVYSLKIKEPVDLIFEYELEGLSENSFVIKSKEKFDLNEFKAFSCELFLRKSQQSVLGKCLSSKENPEGGFSSEFWFVGMDTHLAFQIKTVIKNASKA